MAAERERESAYVRFCREMKRQGMPQSLYEPDMFDAEAEVRHAVAEAIRTPQLMRLRAFVLRPADHDGREC